MSIEEVNIDPPRRESGVHRCLCRLIHADDPKRVDRCDQPTSDLDSPLCNYCIASGHDALPHIPYTDVLRAR